MARTAAVITDRLHLPVDAPPRSPSRWFWGTIVVLTVVTLTLQWVGMKQVKRTLDDFQRLPGASAENFEVVLDKAATQAADAVADQIGVQVDAAIAPVYDRIPDYVGFHYSVAGEYLELATLAVGSLEDAMNERLFEGLPERLDKVALEIDAALADEYERQVREQVNAASSQVNWGKAADVLTQA
ncbi:hypothetical protein [Paracoccus sp. AK26]|uniref:hypothetical protein n=1 Tax=Paracoccus sp. AK26 TaxID=2589076 RepID=UPI0014302165|nr:hypothetical protein [Paracoccus sp. AK26]